MIFIFEGAQCSGKTTLANATGIPILKFPLVKYKNYLCVNDSSMGLYTATKDLAILESMKYITQDLIIDRCFLSTLVYANLFHRRVRQFEFYTECKRLIKEIDIHIIYIDGKEIKRERKDNYDFIDHETQKLYYGSILTELEKDSYTVFKNEYDEESKTNIKILVDNIMENKI